MKLFKNLKKGFTLIELVVVIAVIAILSAVSVVSYVAITNKAKASSDEQAVAQMNTILTANDIFELKSIKDVYEAFGESGLDGEDYKPLMKDRYFFWDRAGNRIVYTDENYVGIYPESYEGKPRTTDWLTLTGKVERREYGEDIESGKISGTAVEAGEKLFSLAEDIKTGSFKDFADKTKQSTLELPATVDLAGAEFNLGKVSNLTISGAQSGTTISNLLTEDCLQVGSAQHPDRKYAAGLIEEITDGNVVLENLVIENSTIGDYSVSWCAPLVGKMTSGKLTIKNCTIKNCYIYSEQKASALVAYAAGGEIDIQNCIFENVHIYSEEGTCGGITGYAANAGIITCDADSCESVKSNVTCELHKVSDRVYKKIDVQLTDASNEVVSCLESGTRAAIYGKDSKHPELNGKLKFKPGCATFGWIADSIIEGSDYFVDYGLRPLHSTDMVK